MQPTPATAAPKGNNVHKKSAQHSQLQAHLIDYKNVDLLKKFLNPHARIVSKKRTGISAKHQRIIANAIKRARFLGLLPYVAR